jgi:hypothetical protein
MAHEKTPKDPQGEAERSSGQTSSAKPEGGTRERTYALPKIDFATFILSINSSALVQLGLIEDPGSNELAKNLPLAKQTIDLLAMLEVKTKGNLTSDEENILKNVLYELRMLYVKERG